MYFLFVLVCLLYFIPNAKREMFNNYYIYKLDLEKTYVPENLKVSILKPQKQLDFLKSVKIRFDELSPKTGAFRGSCNDKINAQLQKKVLNDVFTNLKQEKVYYKTEFSKNNKQVGVDCVAVASDICEFTNPYFYLSQSLYFPPPWTVNSFKNIEYPKNINLSCFNKNYDCCKSSLMV
jgi:hypothetical protein